MLARTTDTFVRIWLRKAGRIFVHYAGATIFGALMTVFVYAMARFPSQLWPLAAISGLMGASLYLVMYVASGRKQADSRRADMALFPSWSTYDLLDVSVYRRRYSYGFLDRFREAKRSLSKPLDEESIVEKLETLVRQLREQVENTRVIVLLDDLRAQHIALERAVADVQGFSRFLKGQGAFEGRKSELLHKVSPEIQLAIHELRRNRSLSRDYIRVFLAYRRALEQEVKIMDEIRSTLRQVETKHKTY